MYHDMFYDRPLSHTKVISYKGIPLVFIFTAVTFLILRSNFSKSLYLILLEGESHPVGHPSFS